LPAEGFTSLYSHIEGHAAERGTKDAVIFLRNGEAVGDKWSYGELCHHVDRLSRGLANRKLPGKRVVVAMEAGIDVVAVILACLRTGTVAIPAPTLALTRNHARLEAILSDSRPSATITSEVNRQRVARLCEKFNAEVVTVADLDLPGGPAEVPAVRPESPALIQYTSGSTREPRGIVVTHGNLVANERMIKCAFEQDERCVSVSWLPHYHDMGLIGAILQPLFVGGTAILMPPLSFLQKPMRWLRAIDKFQATAAGGPCLGYDLCVRRMSLADARSVDLSTWKLAFCGSEPVRAAVLRRFAQHFRAAGFEYRSFVPCYGLAEATLIVSSAARNAEPRDTQILPRGGSIARSYICCGRPVGECVVAVRGEDGRLSEAPHTPGEIYVGGPHVSPGYWSAVAEAVAEYPNVQFTPSGTRMVPTGDVGMLVDGELVPIDRVKDIVIVHGAKIHAIDVEAAIAAGPQGDCVLASAAICVDIDDYEELVVLCEVDRKVLGSVVSGSLAEGLARHVGETHGVLPSVTLLSSGALPRTTSGKIQRAEAKAMFMRGELASHILN
jgi:acyl-CoA synthetase (AMP-forming)/AMP-acid ligase II